jgi:hypothetical protein
MNISLHKIIETLKALDISPHHAELAIAELRGLLAELDEVEVKGRQNIDTLLGCMMALDMIIGKEEKHGE